MNAWGTIVNVNVTNNQKSYAGLHYLITRLEGKSNKEDIDIFTLGLTVNYIKPDGKNLFRYENQRQTMLQEIEKDLCSYTLKIDTLYNNTISSIENEQELEIVEKTGVRKLYYIRILWEVEDDLMILQSLITMLQGLEYCRSRIICFFVPSKGCFYTLKDNPEYYRLSHYLRWIKYVFFYGVFVKEGQPVFAPLSKQDKRNQTTFLPLLEINQNSYGLLTSRVNEKQQKDHFDDIVQIADSFIKNKVSSKLLEKIREIGPSLLHYLILCAIIPDDYKKESEEQQEKMLESYVFSTGEFSDSIFQLLENIIRYSEMHEGVLAFRLRKDNTDFKKSMEDPEYHEKKVFKEEMLSYFEIGISDYNLEETIIDNFLSKEKVIVENISKYRNSIEVKNLFRIYDENNVELKKAWMEYRENNKLTGMGLPRMKETVEEYNAFIFMKSSTKYSLNDPKLYYWRNYDEIDGNNRTDLHNLFFVPGTQFRIVFPVINRENIDVKYNSDIIAPIVGNLREDEGSYAKYFYNKKIPLYKELFTEEIFHTLNGIFNLEYLSGKDQCVQFWTDRINWACSDRSLILKRYREKLHKISRIICATIFGIIKLDPHEVRPSTSLDTR